MKQKVMISAGQHAFEFEGEILELEDSYLVLRAKHGDIYIERKYVVFIQFLNEEEKVVESKPQNVKNAKADHAARFVKSRLRQDPLEEKLEEKLVPPSQFPDDEWDPAYVLHDDEDAEVAKNVLGAIQQHPITKATNLRQAVKNAMSTDEDFSMGMGNVEYKTPLQTVLGMKTKK